MNSGIYKIENIVNKKIYIGSAKNIKNRWYIHKSTLNKNKHENSYLQYAWNKYGKDNFKFEIIEEVDLDKLIEREQYYINLYNVCDRNHGYNLAPNAGNTLGFKFSKESKFKMSQLKKGKPSVRGSYVMSKETKKKIGDANKISQIGRKHSDETKNKISKANKISHLGKTLSEETKFKMKKPHGAMSETTKKKISDWRKGLIPSKKTGKFFKKKENYFISTYNKQRISPMKGKHLSEETKNKLRNRIITNETRIKLSLSCKGKNNGENNGMSISTKQEVISIRKDYNNGISISDLQIKYNKNYMFIYKIVKKLRWNWLDDSSLSN